MSFRIAGSLLAARSAAAAAPRRTVVLVPKYGSPEAMEKEMIEQLRTRVKYQKDLKSKRPPHTQEEEIAEFNRWLNITVVFGLPFCVITYFVIDKEHEPRIENPPEYMGIVKKEWPWRCSECNFFNAKCWQQCRVEIGETKA